MFEPPECVDGLLEMKFGVGFVILDPSFLTNVYELESELTILRSGDIFIK